MTPTDWRPVLLRAPAKLTLTLKLLGSTQDGYHLLDAEMVTVDLHDELRLTPWSTTELTIDGPVKGLPVGPENLVMQSLASVGRTARVELTKRIPTEAGLGGGSADAAAILRWAGVTDPWEAAAIGSDVAFCLLGGRARVTGAGEKIESLPFEPRTVTLLTPPIACSTARVFQEWDRLGGPTGPGTNDLEQAALSIAPELGRWRDLLGDATGQTPNLAGSGSTWFVDGAFPGDGRIVTDTVPAGWS